ncbi:MULTISPECIES: TetR/AcrR family transcriptional regulator [Prauserella salsuginis group]|uniref:AcrR family transcriptional regulator n=2 Tax=Prauserella salsuginis group TaxID=2893672 RepID=A0A839XZ34_9PSEU|nr:MULTISPECIES: TetR/AcrR family transcriptional regulator [Prauserella salsuginis group]MBB3665673.1 AcrR family transcriptional regulator [Prauserella sediminis]MCR3722865.1 transcriptional regulator, TetR family [Prauserella flava]MCR3737460.1 transcriptional regulator, TetR family [Prauserella salsuginis]
MSTGSVSGRRADARRNHEVILAAAAASLTRTGEVSFNAIAKQAGVGVGTVYRHFPTPASLILAVYEREVDHIVEAVPALLAEREPEVAFRTWIMDHLAHYMMTKRGLAEALRRVSATAEESGSLPASAFDRMRCALSDLLRANVDAGKVRADTEVETVIRCLFGLFHLDPQGDWKTEVAKLTDVVWRGIRAD